MPSFRPKNKQEESKIQDLGSGFVFCLLTKRNKMSHSYVPFASVPKFSPEEPKRISCWHILTVVLTVVSSSFATFLLARGVTFYVETDNILEECTSDWNSHFPCHYLKLWIKYHGQANIYDTRCFITVFSIFVIALTTQIMVRFMFVSAM